MTRKQKAIRLSFHYHNTISTGSSSRFPDQKENQKHTTAGIR
jgi:hypothetical protein